MKKDDKKDKKKLTTEVAVTTSFMVFLYLLHTMVKAVAGWIGVQLFKRWWNKFIGLFKKGKNHEITEEISEEESAGASTCTLRGRCDGGRILPSEGESDKS